jgi:hypothetical protein
MDEVDHIDNRSRSQLVTRSFSIRTDQIETLARDAAIAGVSQSAVLRRRIDAIEPLQAAAVIPEVNRDARAELRLMTGELHHAMRRLDTARCAALDAEIEAASAGIALLFATANDYAERMKAGRPLPPLEQLMAVYDNTRAALTPLNARMGRLRTRLVVEVDPAVLVRVAADIEEIRRAVYRIETQLFTGPTQAAP